MPSGCPEMEARKSTLSQFWKLKKTPCAKAGSSKRHSVQRHILSTPKYGSAPPPSGRLPLLCIPYYLRNYRPVSNLPFISKIIEKVIAQQLTDHMKVHAFYEKHQSAYRCYHSTETALDKAQNDLQRAIDDDSGVFLVLLDLSAALDTMDHDIL